MSSSSPPSNSAAFVLVAETAEILLWSPSWTFYRYQTQRHCWRPLKNARKFYEQGNSFTVIKEIPIPEFFQLIREVPSAPPD